jgi:hypothetical protein
VTGLRINVAKQAALDINDKISKHQHEKEQFEIMKQTTETKHTEEMESITREFALREQLFQDQISKVEETRIEMQQISKVVDQRHKDLGQKLIEVEHQQTELNQRRTQFQQQEEELKLQIVKTDELQTNYGQKLAVLQKRELLFKEQFCEFESNRNAVSKLKSELEIKEGNLNLRE